MKKVLTLVAFAFLFTLGTAQSSTVLAGVDLTVSSVSVDVPQGVGGTGRVTVIVRNVGDTIVPAYQVHSLPVGTYWDARNTAADLASPPAGCTVAARPEFFANIVCTRGELAPGGQDVISYEFVLAGTVNPSTYQALSSFIDAGYWYFIEHMSLTSTWATASVSLAGDQNPVNNNSGEYWSISPGVPTISAPLLYDGLAGVRTLHMPGGETDWLGITREGESCEEVQDWGAEGGRWAYTGAGVAHGYVTLTAPQESGNYVMTLYRNNDCTPAGFDSATSRRFTIP